jgi:hypothetical protein
MDRKWAGLAIVFLLAATLIVLLMPVRHTQAQTTAPAKTASAYKTERFNWKQTQEMDKKLTEDAKDGWHIDRVVTVGPYRNDLVFVLIKEQ